MIPSILKIAGMWLPAGPVEVITAGDGAEGVRMIRGHRPAALVLDRMMSNAHGLSILQQSRGDPSLRAERIMGTLAMGYAARAERIQELGAHR